MRSGDTKAGAGRDFSRENRNQIWSRKPELKARLPSELLLHSATTGGEGGVGCHGCALGRTEYSTYEEQTVGGMIF